MSTTLEIVSPPDDFDWASLRSHSGGGEHNVRVHVYAAGGGMIMTISNLFRSGTWTCVDVHRATPLLGNFLASCAFERIFMSVKDAAVLDTFEAACAGALDPYYIDLTGNDLPVATQVALTEIACRYFARVDTRMGVEAAAVVLACVERRPDFRGMWRVAFPGDPGIMARLNLLDAYFETPEVSRHLRRRVRRAQFNVPDQLLPYIILHATESKLPPRVPSGTAWNPRFDLARRIAEPHK